MSQVNTELGLAATTTISLNQANVRTLAGVPSGQISMSNLYGKSNTATPQFSTGATFGSFVEWRAPAQSGFNFSSTGFCSFITSGTICSVSSVTYPPAYITPTGSASGIQVRARVTNLFNPGGGLASNPSWTMGPNTYTARSGTSAWVNVGGGTNFTLNMNSDYGDTFTITGFFDVQRSDGSGLVSRAFNIVMSYCFE